MTYNIQDGGGPRATSIAQVIEAAHPDVVLLNEADDPAVVDALASRLGCRHVWARGSGDKHIALLTRLPILRWRIYNRRPVTQALLAVTLELTEDGGPETEDKPPSVSRLPSAVTIYGVHLLPYFMLLPYEWARWRTVRAVLSVIGREPAHPHLILGDFNAVRRGEVGDVSVFPPARRRQLRLQFNRQPRFALAPLVRAGYADCFRSLHPREPGLTWMPCAPSARLDYIFADPAMAARLRSCDVYTAPPTGEASDHFPLVADFAPSLP